MGLNFYGYTPKLADFAASVSRDVGDLSFWSSVHPSVIENSKDRLLRTFRSCKGHFTSRIYLFSTCVPPFVFTGVKERPDAQCESLLRYMLQEGTWLPQDRLKACEAIDVSYFHHRVANTLQFDRAVSYTHGDCSLETAIRSHRQVRTNANAANVKRDLGEHLARGESQTLGAVRADGESLRVDGERSRLLPGGSHQVVALPAFNNEDPNCALVTFMQVRLFALKVIYKIHVNYDLFLILFCQLCNTGGFHEPPHLRDDALFAPPARRARFHRAAHQETAGLHCRPLAEWLRKVRLLDTVLPLFPLRSLFYPRHFLIFQLSRGWKSIRGISVRILSRHHSPVAMESALSDFFAGQREVLSGTLTDEAVAERSAAIIRSLEDPPTTYSEEASEHWDSIVHGMPFDWTQRVIAELRTLDKAAVMTCAEQWLFDPATRSSVSVMIFSPEHEAQRQQLMTEDGAAGLPSFGLQGAVSRYFSVDAVTTLRDSLELAQNPTIL